MAAVILKYNQQYEHLYKVRGISYSGSGSVYTLGVFDGYMYLSVPEETLDSYIPQPAQVDMSQVTLTSELSAVLYKHAGPCVRLDKRTRRAIREKYSVDEEFKALRTNDAEYYEFVDSIVSKHKQQKLSILGLSDFVDDVVI